ncbi:hypothetical protein Tco_1477293, partial [Tanacetum coccineum]
MITANSRTDDRKPSGLMLPPQLKIVGILERALCKLVPKDHQQKCPRKSILAEGQERSSRPKRSHEYVPSKPTS